jgi:hypothetical protein
VSADPTIEVTVIQVAGTQAYLRPGTGGGVRRRAIAVINHRQYSVVQATTSFAVIEVGNDPPREQDKGQATVVGAEADKPVELAKPRPLSAWKDEWTEEEPPASRQHPRYVPLGSEARDRRWDLRLSATAGGVIPIGRGVAIARAEINARLHAEPFDAPAAFDFDGSVQGWGASNLDARAGGSARPLIWVREALISYGTRAWYGGLGRMRYAASTLGTLDGTRVRASLGEGFSAGAFGGLLPNPLSGAPSLDAQRFGVEATYNRPTAELRPEAALVIHGSTFRGSLDERRVSGTFGLYPGLSRVGGYFEVTNFDTNNPWKASAIALTAAGVDTSVRMGIFQIGGRFDLRQPDRSRWLASFLPPSWLCQTIPAPAGAAAPGPQPCDGSVSTRGLAMIDASVEYGNVSVTVGGSTMRDLTLTDGTSPDMIGGFASGRMVRIANVARVSASASYSQSTDVNILDGWAGPGVTLLDDALDLSAYYRAATLRYRFAATSLTEQGVGITAEFFPNAEVAFTVQGEAMGGDDAKAFLLFGTVMWHPRF